MDRLRAIGPAALLILAASTHAAAQQPSVLARNAPSLTENVAVRATGSIQGIVIDDHGRPLAGALVSALGTTTSAVETGSDGRFRLSGLVPDAYVVRAHRLGFAASRQVVLQVRAGAPVVSSLILRELQQQFAGVGAVVSPLPLGLLVTEAEATLLERPDDGAIDPLPASLEVDDANDEVEPSDPAADSADDDHGHGELPWRLRHLKRSVLRDVTPGVPGVDSPRSGARPSYASALFGNPDISGQFNFLTVTSFDGPADLIGDELPRGITYVSLGAPAGDDGRWSVRGAVTQGDVSSWYVGGSLHDEIADVHDVDVAMSYATQRYTGGNLDALAALADGSRNVGALSGHDSWRLSKRATITYGAAYANYDYLERSHLVSPQAGLALGLGPRTRVIANVSQLMIAPGAEEFLPPPMEGVWLPPERTFSPLVEGARLRPQRTRHTDLGLQHDLAPGYVVGVRRFRQATDDQLATMFDVRVDGEERQNLGHYYVASPGNVSVQGWAVSLSAAVADRVRGSIGYAIATADWAGSPEVATIGLTAASAVRTGQERFHDLTTAVETDIAETGTRLYVFYRVNTAFARADADDPTAAVGSRFDVRVQQGLPFLGFTNVDWELLLAVRNLFHEPLQDASVYDELLTVRPPKRIVGGVTVRF